MEKTDKKTLEKIDEKKLEEARKNTDYLNALLLDNKQLIKSIARKYFILGGEEDDLVQEGMVGLFNAILRFDADKGVDFKTFANYLIRNEIFTAIKKYNTEKNKVLTQSFFIDDDIVPGADSPENDFLESETYINLKKKINKNLTDFEMAVFEKYLQGYSYNEIATEINKPVKSIDNALSRIKNKFKNMR